MTVSLPPLTEKAVEHLCDQLVLAMGGKVVRFSMVQRTRQTYGIPDRRYRFPNQNVVFWFECKKPDGKLTRDQADFLDQEMNIGALCCVGGVVELQHLMATVKRQRTYPATSCTALACIFTYCRANIDAWKARGYRGEKTPKLTPETK